MISSMYKRHVGHLQGFLSTYVLVIGENDGFGEHDVHDVHVHSATVTECRFAS